MAKFQYTPVSRAHPYQLSSSGTNDLSGSFAVLSAVASGTTTSTGALNALLPAVSVDALGTVASIGNLDTILANLAVYVIGTVAPTKGQIHAILPQITSDISAAPAGIISEPLITNRMVASILGGGRITSELANIICNAAGNTWRNGTIDQQLPVYIESSILGGGRIGQVLCPVEGGASGVSGDVGSIIAYAPRLSAVIEGVQEVNGAVAGQLSQLIATLVGTIGQVGDICIILSPDSGMLHGVIGQLGNLSSPLPEVAGVGSGTATNHGSIQIILPTSVVHAHLISDSDYVIQYRRNPC